jgi:hypothetical protein
MKYIKGGWAFSKPRAASRDSETNLVWDYRWTTRLRRGLATSSNYWSTRDCSISWEDGLHAFLTWCMSEVSEQAQTTCSTGTAYCPGPNYHSCNSTLSRQRTDTQRESPKVLTPRWWVVNGRPEDEMLSSTEQRYLTILYATQTGNAQDLAESLVRSAIRQRFTTHCLSMEGYSPVDLQYRIVLSAGWSCRWDLCDLYCEYNRWWRSSRLYDGTKFYFFSVGLRMYPGLLERSVKQKHTFRLSRTSFIRHPGPGWFKIWEVTLSLVKLM